MDIFYINILPNSHANVNRPRFDKEWIALEDCV